MSDHTPPPDSLPSDEAEPELLATTRMVSLAGILERLETQFNVETAGRPECFDEPDERIRREVLRNVADYVLTTAGITLTRADRLSLLETLYQEVFNFGALAPYLDDPTVTEIKITGRDRFHIRRAHAEMQLIEGGFRDEAALERTVSRLLSRAGVALGETQPFLEAGLLMRDRPARVTLAGRAVSSALHVQIRLHPNHPYPLSTLAGQAEPTLQQLLAGPHGLMIVGEAGAGKTSLIQAGLPLLGNNMALVERARELRPPTLPQIQRFDGHPPRDFAEQIRAAQKTEAATLILDEIRFDEGEAVWAALRETPARCIFALRSAANPLRLQAALRMAIQRAVSGLASAEIDEQIVLRLPYVVFMAKHQVARLGQWQGGQNGLTLNEIYPNLA
jgi:type IV secretory pathway ATPase VirB11/archaellum biosynthesis ATPase